MDENQTLHTLERSLIAGRIGRRAFIAGAVATGLVGSQTATALADDLDKARATQARNARNLKKAYDYVVVGAGSAGCTLVGTLAEREPHAEILLVEAGDWDTNPAELDPRLCFTNLGTDRAWNDVSLPTPSTNNHPVPEFTGRAIGGGSSINATIWARPFKADLDNWARVTGDDRWDYAHGLEHFKSVEDWQGTPNPAFRGTGGPVWVQPSADPLPLATAALDGMREVGLPVVDDLNASGWLRSPWSAQPCVRGSGGADSPSLTRLRSWGRCTGCGRRAARLGGSSGCCATSPWSPGMSSPRHAALLATTRTSSSPSRHADVTNAGTRRSRTTAVC